MPYVTLNSPSQPFAVMSTPSVSGSLVAATFGVALPVNPARKAFYVQSVGSGGSVYVGYGPTVTASQFHILLKGSTTDLGADGGSLYETMWQGQVSISGGIGTKWVAWEAS